MRGDRLRASGRRRSRPRARATWLVCALALVAAGCSGPTAADRPVLHPARVRPVSDVCRLEIVHSSRGGIAPLLCPGGGVNVDAWQALAFGSVQGGPAIRPGTLGAGPLVDANQIWAMLCNDAAHVYGSTDKALAAERLATAYYGWRFERGDPVALFNGRGCPAPHELQDGRYAGEHVVVSLTPYRGRSGTRVTVYGAGFIGEASTAALASAGVFTLVEVPSSRVAAACPLRAVTPVGSVSVDNKGELGASFVIPSQGSCPAQGPPRSLPAGVYDLVLAGSPGAIAQLVVTG